MVATTIPTTNSCFGCGADTNDADDCVMTTQGDCREWHRTPMCGPCRDRLLDAIFGMTYDPGDCIVQAKATDCVLYTVVSGSGLVHRGQESRCFPKVYRGVDMREI
ncbi:MAG TPA: hypothetical protein PK093_24830 [Phycisphaerae bacterium]|nr:hypothetical protein [Phycisphaerae bacterium]